jgi:hypothetical protein
MPDISMFEAAVDHENDQERAVARWITEVSPIAEIIPQKSIQGAAYRYDSEASLGTVAFRGVGGSYSPDHGVINPNYEGLVILGGEVTVDNFEVEQMGVLRDLKGERFRMKARQMGITYSENFFEADTAVQPYGPDGARKRIQGSQLHLNASGGGPLDLNKLDEMIDSVVGDDGGKTLFMNRACQRFLRAAVAIDGSTFQIQVAQDAFRRPMYTYRGIPIRIIERDDDASTFLGFDEDPGDATPDTASIYCLRFGMDYVFGITGKRGMPGVKDFGEIEDRPAHLGRIEWFFGYVFKHPRSAARLYGITNVYPT